MNIFKILAIVFLLLGLAVQGFAVNSYIQNSDANKLPTIQKESDFEKDFVKAKVKKIAIFDQGFQSLILKVDTYIFYITNENNISFLMLSKKNSPVEIGQEYVFAKEEGASEFRKVLEESKELAKSALDLNTSPKVLYLSGKKIPASSNTSYQLGSGILLLIALSFFLSSQNTKTIKGSLKNLKSNNQ